MAIKARADIANTAVRIFLQDFGAAYDEIRDLPKYMKGKHFPGEWCGGSANEPGFVASPLTSFATGSRTVSYARADATS